MSDDKYLFMAIYLCGIIVAAISQIILKKSTAEGRNDKLIKLLPRFASTFVEKHINVLGDYLTPKAVSAYCLFFLSSLVTVWAYGGVPLSLGPILGATEYIFVSVLGRVVLKEHISYRKLAGLILIVCGVVVSAYSKIK